MYKYLFVVVFLFTCLSISAQKASVSMNSDKNDSLKINRYLMISKTIAPKYKKFKTDHPDSSHSPRKAVIRSLIFPGLGQMYNRQGLWWRLPALYAGLSLLAYNIYSNSKDYNVFLKEAIWRQQNRPFPTDGKGNQLKDGNGNLITGEPLPYYNGAPISNVSDPTIIAYKDNLLRNRDLSIFGFVGVWAVNMIDAYVAAKFIHSYSVDGNLSYKIAPALIGNASGAPVYASNLNTTFTPALKVTFVLR